MGSAPQVTDLLVTYRLVVFHFPYSMGLYLHSLVLGDMRNGELEHRAGVTSCC